MDVIKYFNIKKRMCNERTNCSECPFKEAVAEKKLVHCRNLELEYPDEVEAIVERWEKEHPIKTRQSEFLKLFPNAKVSENGVIAIDPCEIDEKFSCPFNDRISCCEQCREAYWFEEVEDGIKRDT